MALYNQYLEQAPASISEGEDFAVAALEGFTQYAVEEGIIEDTVEQRAAITKAVVRAEFKLVVAGGNVLGYTAAATLLNHSLQDNPSNLSYGSTTDMAKQIAGSTECRTIVNQFKSDVTGTNYVRKTNSGTTTLNSTTDLHLAYNNVNYSATGVKSNGKWTLTITFTDTYDFDAQSWKNAMTDNALVTILNNYAAYAQSIGANHYTGKVAVNTRSYIYTNNPPANPYCEVKLYVTDSKDFEIYIGYTKLQDAMERK